MNESTSKEFSSKEIENLRSLSGLDKLQQVTAKRWISEPIALESHFKKYYEELQHNKFEYKTLSQREGLKFSEAMGLDVKLVEELKNVCS